MEIPVSTLATTAARLVSGRFGYFSGVKPVSENINSVSQGCQTRVGRRDIITTYTHNEKIIKVDGVNTVPEGTIMLSHCTKFGTYAMFGNSRRLCHRGRWNGTEPSCSKIDFQKVKMPIVTLTTGSGTLSPDGHLRIKQGTWIRLNCELNYGYLLKWTWSNKRSETTSQIGYRITTVYQDRKSPYHYNVDLAFNAKLGDAGVFGCKCGHPDYQEAKIYVEII